jgi:hypothetical protein
MWIWIKRSNTVDIYYEKVKQNSNKTDRNKNALITEKLRVEDVKYRIERNRRRPFNNAKKLDKHKISK